jgi:hypothetical protein
MIHRKFHYAYYNSASAAGSLKPSRFSIRLRFSEDSRSSNFNPLSSLRPAASRSSASVPCAYGRGRAAPHRRSFITTWSSVSRNVSFVPSADLPPIQTVWDGVGENLGF